MAVLEAVRGYEYYAGLPHIGHEEKEEGSDGDEDEDADADTTSTEDELGEGMWSKEKLENELDSLLNSDYVNLLLQHEHHMGSAESSPRKYFSKFKRCSYSQIPVQSLTWMLIFQMLLFPNTLLLKTHLCHC